ncbi:hypothetical protein R1flu_027365 [Riccia fluitans]|uniref:Thioredoxin domain-containing protein n=1 Tax=Riccia fluitans TaxID=41844 RepID=A0ABD1XIM4_9MARC
MAAAVGSCLRIDSYVVARFSAGERGVSCKCSSNEAETISFSRNVHVQSSAVAECGGGIARASMHCSNSSKIGCGEARRLKFGRAEDDRRLNGGRMTRSAAVSPQAYFEARPEPKLTVVPLELICTEGDFDRVLSEAQERNEPIVIDWMASWCRKCLYLKPKLEKLAAVYYPNIKFYYVDVNHVPQSMVKRAQVTQMPTIQLWRNGAQEGEVIGGHQANTVVDLVKDMVTKGMRMEEICS